MSKPLFCDNKNFIDKIIETLRKQLTESPVDIETERITLDLDTSDEKAELIFTPTAWIKMKALVEEFSTEVEWHGLVRRAAKNVFVIEDILNFAHEVTGATVTSDQEAYNKFIDSLPDEVFDKMKMHGHSHVNMGTTPSSTDMEYRKNVVNNTGAPTPEHDEFQIFVIWNKRDDHEAQIYDLTNNILYGVKDIIIKVGFEDGTTLKDFIKEAKKLTTTRTYQANNNYGNYGHTYGSYNDGYDWGDNDGYAHCGNNNGYKVNTGTVSDVKPASQSTQLKITDGTTPHQSTKFKKSGFADMDGDELDYVGHEHGRPQPWGK